MVIFVRKIFACAVIAASLVFLVALQANAACELPTLRTNERPTVDEGPTKVFASIIVADLLGVDDVNQQLEIDMRVRFTWTDPRLEGLEGCRFNVTEVWFPQALILNSNNLRILRSNARNQVVVGDKGTVHYAQRATGQISSYHNLRAFPFDSHDFLIEFASIEEPADELVFIADLENTWLSDRLNIEGWYVNSITIRSEPEKLRDTGYDVSILKLFISAERNPEYYIYRVLVLLAFVVAMSWTIFWIPPSRFEFQIGLGATSMLTAIAFNLSLASQLPTLGYMTTLDRMLIWSIILVFLSIVQALVSGRMVLKDREELALKLDRVCRYLFPAALFLGWLVFYLAV